MSRTWKWIIAAVLAVLIILFFVKKASNGPQTEKIAVEEASNRTITETVSTSGKIYPVTEIRVSPDFSGQVTDLKVSEGDTVKKGQTLAVINNRSSIEASISGIVLSLKVKKGESVTGNSFSVGTEIMTIADMSQLEIRADVGENDIVKITVGDSADVTVDAYNNRKFKGVVKSIANSTRTSGSAIPGTGDISNYEVRILMDTSSYRDLAEKRLPFRPGMNTSVEIRTRTAENVLAVPIAAVNARVKDTDKNIEEKRKEDQAKQEEGINTNETGGQLEEVVFVLQKDNTVRKQVVKTGIQDINYIQVTEGIKAGDQVVIGPYSALSRNLRNGMKVKVVAKDKLFEN